MPLEMIEYELGPLENRTTLVFDPVNKVAVVVDPAFGCQTLIDDIQRKGLMLDRVLITHTHFDHIGGAAELVRSFSPHPLISIHPDDLALWQAGGGASNFGFHVDLDVEFKTDLADKQVIKLGSEEILVKHTPGHSRGHVIFIIPSLKCALVGDLIFYLGVGRTDLPGGDGSTLIKSIRESILTLDNETKLFPGHGPFTTVGYERENNPFL